MMTSTFPVYITMSSPPKLYYWSIFIFIHHSKTESCRISAYDVLIAVLFKPFYHLRDLFLMRKIHQPSVDA